MGEKRKHNEMRYYITQNEKKDKEVDIEEGGTYIKR